MNPVTAPADILVVRGGVATGPAALAAILVYGALSRHRLVAMADAVAPAALAGLAGWQAGCLTRAACLGAPSDLPWAWTTPGGTVTRHPVELYAAVGFLAGAVALTAWKRRGRPAPGAAASAALVLAGLVRLGTEPIRPSLGGGPVWWYGAGIVVGIVGLTWSLRRTTPRGSGALAP